MISNPSRGTYPDVGRRGGIGLYHFSPYDNTRELTLKMNNTILLASGFEHAVQLYKEVFETILEREEGRTFDRVEVSFNHDVASRNTRNRMKEYLEVLNKVGVDSIEYVPAIHPFIVGWAVNDVIL